MGCPLDERDDAVQRPAGRQQLRALSAGVMSQVKYHVNRWRTSKFERRPLGLGIDAVVGLRRVGHVVLAVARGVDRVRPACS